MLKEPQILKIPKAIFAIIVCIASTLNGLSPHRSNLQRCSAFNMP